MLLHFFPLPTPGLFTSPSHHLIRVHHRRLGAGWPLRAVEKESEFEFDPEKAREALRKLDEQLESLSQKQTAAPKRRPAPPPQMDPYNENEPMMSPKISRSDELPEISGSYLAYFAVLLLIITVFYNALFLLVIKPAIDGSDMEPPALNGEPLKGRVDLQPTID